MSAIQHDVSSTSSTVSLSIDGCVDDVDDNIVLKNKIKLRKRKIRHSLWNEIRHEIVPITIGSIAMIGSTICNQAVPRLLGKVIDRSSSSTNTNTSTVCSRGTNITSSLALVVLGGGLSSFLRTCMLYQAKNNIVARLRSDAFRLLLTRREYQWFDTTSNNKKREQHDDEENMKDNADINASSPGAIHGILSDDVPKIAESLTLTLANLIRSTCACSFATFHMFILDPSLLGISSSIFPLVGILAVLVHKYVKRVSNIQDQLNTQASAFCEERLNYLGTVRNSGRDVDESNVYQQLQTETAKLGQRTSFAKGVFMGFNFLSSAMTLAVVFHAGGKSVKCRQMSHGQLTGFAAYAFLLGLGVGGFMQACGEYLRGYACAERLYGLMDIDDEIDNEYKEKNKSRDVDVVVVPHKFVHTITLENVSFTYRQNDTPTVQDVSFSIKRGEVVALIGVNGSGKSTIASILSGLLTPDSGGMVRADAYDFHTLDRLMQSQIVALVSQYPSFFDLTLYENLIYANQNATNEEIDYVLNLANCHEFVNQLEGGKNYKIGRNGHKLSGGQKQRLALARALLTDPCLLILDEPISSMDHDGQQAVKEVVLSCRNGNCGETYTTNRRKRGVLLITHRREALMLADRIVVLKEGSVVEYRTWKSLSNEYANRNTTELGELLPELQ